MIASQTTAAATKSVLARLESIALHDECKAKLTGLEAQSEELEQTIAELENTMAELENEQALAPLDVLSAMEMLDKKLAEDVVAQLNGWWSQPEYQATHKPILQAVLAVAPEGYIELLSSERNFYLADGRSLSVQAEISVAFNTKDQKFYLESYQLTDFSPDLDFSNLAIDFQVEEGLLNSLVEFVIRCKNEDDDD